MRQWFDGGAPDVPVLRPAEAQEVVAGIIDRGEATYEESLNGYWHWSLAAWRAGVARDLDALRPQVLDAVAACCTGGLQLARLLPPPPPPPPEDAGQPGSCGSDGRGCKDAGQPEPCGSDESGCKEPQHSDGEGGEAGQRLLALLRDLRPFATTDPAVVRRAAAALASEVEHDDGPNAEFDFRWLDAETGDLNVVRTGSGKQGFVRLLEALCKGARLGLRVISLSVRVRVGSALNRLCWSIAARHGMPIEAVFGDDATSICPRATWGVGPPLKPAAVTSEADDPVRMMRLPAGGDPRFYLILGAPGGLTPSHWDRGVQTVLYHTVAGTNHALALPRKVALMLSAVSDGVGRAGAAWCHALELEALQACRAAGELGAGTFVAGETMLIAPGGGHSVLTGDDGKVVLAGEWHLRSDLSSPGRT